MQRFVQNFSVCKWKTLFLGHLSVGKVNVYKKTSFINLVSNKHRPYKHIDDSKIEFLEILGSIESKNSHSK
jgi:hypothetical protein